MYLKFNTMALFSNLWRAVGIDFRMITKVVLYPTFGKGFLTCDQLANLVHCVHSFWVRFTSQVWNFGHALFTSIYSQNKCLLTKNVGQAQKINNQYDFSPYCTHKKTFSKWSEFCVKMCCTSFILEDEFRGLQLQGNMVNVSKTRFEKSHFAYLITF